MPRSFGALKKSTLNSTSGGQTSVQSNITLPEGAYFTSRRTADDFDRTINYSNFMDDCFGFDDDDEIDNNNDTLIEESKSKSLNEIRARLKRFLHNPDAADASIKKTKIIDKDRPARKRAIQKTPIKTPAKKSDRTPIKRNVVFADTGAKQKDIRSAFTAKMQQNNKHAKTGTNTSDESIALFEEVVPVCRI